MGTPHHDIVWFCALIGDEAYGQQDQCILKPRQCKIFLTYTHHDDDVVINDIILATSSGPLMREIKLDLVDLSKLSNRNTFDKFRFEYELVSLSFG